MDSLAFNNTGTPLPEENSANIINSIAPMDKGSPDGPGPMRQNPTAQRLAEVMAAWVPDSQEGIYHRYLQSLSPAYDHLLTFSRNDRIWRFSHLPPHRRGYRSEISTLASPMYVLDMNKVPHTDQKYDGTDLDSMKIMKDLLARPNPNPATSSPRIVCAQHLTCLSMEALGSGLSMDPNVLSHHLGMSFKAIEQTTGLKTIGTSKTKTEDIPTSIGAYERDRNLQIVKSELGLFQFANVDHAKDLTLRDTVSRTIFTPYRLPLTISIGIPRTIYVQGYQDQNAGASAIKSLRTESLGLQDVVLNRRIARQRFADDDFICDQGEKYTQNGLDILQHVTIHVTDDNVLVLFPPYPEFPEQDGDNDPWVFLDPLSRRESTKTFQEFSETHDGNVNERAEQATCNNKTRVYDVDVFAKDISQSYRQFSTWSRDIHLDRAISMRARVAYLVRSYAINAWFDRLQSLESQLHDLSSDLLHTIYDDETNGQQLEKRSQNSFIQTYGREIIDAIHHYITSLDLECDRLKHEFEAVDSISHPHFGQVRQALDEYCFIKTRMRHLLHRAQSLLDRKATKIQDSQESKDSTPSYTGRSNFEWSKQSDTEDDMVKDEDSDF
ncbi:unnamed protein product [Penicillium salamii]|uniref:Uncharacterized protein n=1 Tax=Penicillium salamii TaxID=1612424 RepID=A0A9W4IDQ2_9EURO|nr:unnamed protein product [Penicillium salamii]CAG7965341.1 unnamed protein product [Penicillium salamii]CAG8019266.1 unnamed protein product [Penicillium salamii]CAG8088339.1 unnamed protein product [Penicillium salamii]CAG8105205.1 unnamed protein product [Penicillium salamii]